VPGAVVRPEANPEARWPGRGHFGGLPV